MLVVEIVQNSCINQIYLNPSFIFICIATMVIIITILCYCAGFYILTIKWENQIAHVSVHVVVASHI